MVPALAHQNLMADGITMEEACLRERNHTARQEDREKEPSVQHMNPLGILKLYSNHSMVYENMLSNTAYWEAQIES